MDRTRSPRQRLPPGPSEPALAQAALWAWRYPQFTGRAHERFGPTFSVRIGGLPPAVVTTDADAIRRLFTGDPLVKRHGNDLLLPVLGEHSVLVLEPREHLERRRLLLSPFHGESVQAYARLMEELVEAELDGWRPGGEVRMLPRAQELTLEVILQAVLGVRDPGARARLRTLYDGMVNVPGSAVLFYLPQLSGRSRWNVAGELFYRRLDEVHRLIAAHVARTRADPALDERRDVLARLVRTGDGAGLGDEELRDELNTLLIAGHETTAGAIAWGAVLLAHHPDVQARARAAARAGEHTRLDALVREILRIRPPVPVAAARQVLEPFTIGEHEIDPGVAVIVDAWGVHHDPARYPDPDELRPQRFGGGGADAYGFLTFGGGAHRCIGAALAQLELRVVLGAILRRFELVPADASLPRPARRGITLVPSGGGRVRLATAAG